MGNKRSESSKRDSKKINKQNKKQRLKSNEALKKATGNMNLQPTVKYDLPPSESENKLIESEEYKLQYDFRRLKKIDKTSARYSRYDQEKDKKLWWVRGS